jgi:hypothetical protein
MAKLVQKVDIIRLGRSSNMRRTATNSKEGNPERIKLLVGELKRKEVQEIY